MAAAQQGNYLAAIEEVRQWLCHTKLDEFIYTLLDHGYDDLDAISRANDHEIAEVSPPPLIPLPPSHTLKHMDINSWRIYSKSPPSRRTSGGW